MAPVRLRSSADMMGRMLRLMEFPSLTLEINGRGQTSHAPGRIQACGERCENGQGHCDADAEYIDVGDILRATLVELLVDRVQRLQGPQAGTGEHQPEHRAHGGEQSRFHEVLNEYLAAARTQGATNTGKGCAVEILGQQQADGIDETYGEERKHQADEHPIVIADDTLVDEPLSDARQPVVAGSRKTSGLVLLSPVVIEISLHALARVRVGQLDPHLDPDTVGGEIGVEAFGEVDSPTLVITGGGNFSQRRGPAERNVHVLQRHQASVVEIVELGLWEPVIENTHDSQLHIVPADRAPDTVDTAEQEVVHHLAQDYDGLCRIVGGRAPSSAIKDGRLEH